MPAVPLFVQIEQLILMVPAFVHAFAGFLATFFPRDRCNISELYHPKEKSRLCVKDSQVIAKQYKFSSLPGNRCPVLSYRRA